jgi:hypothetical protein
MFYVSVLWQELPFITPAQVKVEVTLRLTVGQSICQGIEPTLRLVTRFHVLSEGCLQVAVLLL